MFDFAAPLHTFRASERLRRAIHADARPRGRPRCVHESISFEQSRVLFFGFVAAPNSSRSSQASKAKEHAARDTTVEVIYVLCSLTPTGCARVSAIVCGGIAGEGFSIGVCRRRRGGRAEGGGELGASGRGANVYERATSPPSCAAACERTFSRTLSRFLVTGC